MSLSISGINTSDCSVTGVNDLGFWVLVSDGEYFIPFSDYPGFKESTVYQLLNIQYDPPSQLRWNDLDIDIELEALSQPERFPLIYK
jgi:hypothetical protein